MEKRAKKAMKTMIIMMKRIMVRRRLIRYLNLRGKHQHLDRKARVLLLESITPT